MSVGIGQEERECPLCLSLEAQIVLALPPTPLGDRFCSSAEEALSLKSYPLGVARCTFCKHLFVSSLTNADDSYQNYLFESGSSPGLSRAFQEIAHETSSRHNIDGSSLILDIGGNDGTWLDCFRQSGAELVLVEPAPEPASIAQGIGIPVIRDYFSLEAVNQSGLVRKPPRIISLNFVFANMPSPKDVLRQIVQLSDPSTIISIMTGYHPAQLQVGMFDYVYHEHLSYFSCWDFQKMAKEFGLTITYAREVPLKGGSLHIEMQLFKDSTDESEVFKTMLKREAWIDSPIGNQWASVSHKISSAQETVRAEITKARLDSMAVIGYGASHSTTTLSHALAISSDFDVIIDDNPLKHGRFAPGTGVAVEASQAVIDGKPALFIILAWQHGPSILESLRQSKASGRVLMLFPVFYLEELG